MIIINPDDMLSTQEVARKLNVSRESVRRFILNGDIRAIQLGKVYRIHPDWLEDYIKRHEVEPINNE